MGGPRGRPLRFGGAGVAVAFGRCVVIAEMGRYMTAHFAIAACITMV
jgi:hypothetical protein